MSAILKKISFARLLLLKIFNISFLNFLKERKFFNKDQYSSYIGCPIKIRYKNEENKYLSTKGILEKVNGEGLILKSTNKDFFIDFNSIDKANLEYTRE